MSGSQLWHMNIAALDLYTMTLSQVFWLIISTSIYPDANSHGTRAPKKSQGLVDFSVATSNFPCSLYQIANLVLVKCVHSL